MLVWHSKQYNPFICIMLISTVFWVAFICDAFHTTHSLAECTNLRTMICDPKFMEERQFSVATTVGATENLILGGMTTFRGEQTNFIDDLHSAKPSTVTC